MDIQEKIENLSEEKFDNLFIDLHTKIKENPLKNFVESSLFCDTKSTPGQRVFFKLVFKQKLDNSEKLWVYREITDENHQFELTEVWMTEQELYEFYTGKPYIYSDTLDITDISLIIGRRGSKTLSSSILAIYSALKMNWKPLLGKKRVATILVMSHTREFSDETIEEIKYLIEDSPILSRLINRKKKNTQSTINLKIPFLDEKTGNITYSYVRIRTNAASSKSSRGSACPVILMDEIAFWGSDVNSKETDSQILNAVTPSTLQFGIHSMLIKLSSPFIKSGVLWNDYKERFNLPKNCLVLKAPSWMFNNILPATQFKIEWQKKRNDLIAFDCEYRANFIDSASIFFPIEILETLRQKGVLYIPAQKGGQYSAAIDAAFKSDRFIFTITGFIDGKFKQCVLKKWEGTRENPVQVSEVVEFISNISKEYGISIVYADQYAYEPLRQWFAPYGIELEEATFSQPFKHKIYFNLKNLVLNKQIELLDDNLTFVELSQLQVERTDKGKVSIGHPVGGSDDCADALALSAFTLRQKCDRLGIDFAQISAGTKTYGIEVDARTGMALTAPSPEMLAGQFGVPAQVIDTTELIRKNPITGQYEIIEEDEEEDANSDSCDWII